MTQATDLKIRWLIRRDVPEVMDIERRQLLAGNTGLMLESELMTPLRQRNIVGMVVEDSDFRITGWMMYRLEEKRLELLSLSVDPERQREGIGSAMVERLIEKLSNQRRSVISAVVPDTNLTACLFFKANGFRAIDVLRDEYGNGNDGYQFAWNLP